jgi:hypothetical protein
MRGTKVCMISLMGWYDLSMDKIVRWDEVFDSKVVYQVVWQWNMNLIMIMLRALSSGAQLIF